jgi:predicted membrane protein (TIGR00267 family)
MAEKELGIQFAPPGSPVNDAVVMGVSFVLGAAVPILPYFWIPPATGVFVSVGLTLAALFGMGALKARLTEASWLRSGLEVALLGGAAALLSFAVGQFLPGALGVSPPAG